eukprot:6332485-Prymnesium_polylepis.1
MYSDACSPRRTRAAASHVAAAGSCSELRSETIWPLNFTVTTSGRIVTPAASAPDGGARVDGVDGGADEG